MRFPARGRVRRPRGVARGDVEILGMRGIALPARHGEREIELAPFAPEARVQLGPQVLRIERRRDIRLVRVHRLALHEQALDGVERREAMMLGLERTHFVADPEELREEILDVGTDADQQVRFRLRRQGAGLGARDDERIVQCRRGRAQMAEEQRVDARRTVIGIEVAEVQSRGEREARHVVEGHGQMGAGAGSTEPRQRQGVRAVGHASRHFTGLRQAASLRFLLCS